MTNYTDREILDVAATEAETAVKAALIARKAAETLKPAAETAVRAAEFVAAEAKKLRPPDGRSPASAMYRQLASEEQSSLARLLPRRNRWSDVAAFDEKVVGLEDIRRRLAAEREHLTVQHQGAENIDRQALADWHLNGGRRPTPTAPALAARIAELDRETEAAALAIDQTLAAKVKHVEGNRGRLVETADRDLAAKSERVLALVDELAAARQELGDASATAGWARTFPHPSAASTLPAQLVALGRQQPVAKHLDGYKGQVNAERLFQLLRDDAQMLRDSAPADQVAA